MRNDCYLAIVFSSFPSFRRFDSVEKGRKVVHGMLVERKVPIFLGRNAVIHMDLVDLSRASQISQPHIKAQIVKSIRQRLRTAGNPSERVVKDAMLEIDHFGALFVGQSVDTNDVTVFGDHFMSFEGISVFDDYILHLLPLHGRLQLLLVVSPEEDQAIDEAKKNKHQSYWKGDEDGDHDGSV